MQPPPIPMDESANPNVMGYKSLKAVRDQTPRVLPVWRETANPELESLTMMLRAGEGWLGQVKAKTSPWTSRLVVALSALGQIIVERGARLLDMTFELLARGVSMAKGLLSREPQQRELVIGGRPGNIIKSPCQAPTMDIVVGVRDVSPLDSQGISQLFQEIQGPEGSSFKAVVKDGQLVGVIRDMP